MTHNGAPFGPSMAGAGGMVDAILREVATLLSRLLETGEGGVISLRAMPLSSADRAALDERLGRGEVSATLTIAGHSEIWETNYPGVWWIRHRGAGDKIAVEEIAITRVPEILVAQIDDARDGLDRLEAALALAAASLAASDDVPDRPSLTTGAPDHAPDPMNLSANPGDIA